MYKKLLLQSIQLRKNFLYTFLLDVVAYGIAFILFSFFFSTFTATMSSIPDTPVLDPEVTSAAELQAIQGQLQGAITSAITSALFTVVLLFVAWHALKGALYSVLLKKKFNAKIFGKYIAVKLIWIVLWVVPWILLSAVVKPSLFMLVVGVIIALYLHFTFVLNVEFFHAPKFSVLKKVVKKHFGYCRYFWKPEALIAAAFIVVVQLYWVYRGSPNGTVLFISSALFLVFAALSRNFLFLSTKKAFK